MQVTLPAHSHRHIAHRMAPIACGAGLVASAALVATNNPSAGGFHFPTCPFHQMTGLWCPACGLTRVTYQLLHGHVVTALSFNVFTPLVLAGMMVAWLAWLPVTWGATPRGLPALMRRVLTTVAPSVVIAYGILRNIPIGFLRPLAP